MTRQNADNANQADSLMKQANQVVNAANAEESASASEEMSAQAEQMNAFVAELVALVGSSENGHRSIGSRDKEAEKVRTPLNSHPPSRFSLQLGAAGKKGSTARPDRECRPGPFGKPPLSRGFLWMKIRRTSKSDRCVSEEHRPGLRRMKTHQPPPIRVSIRRTRRRWD